MKLEYNIKIELIETKYGHTKRKEFFFRNLFRNVMGL